MSDGLAARYGSTPTTPICSVDEPSDTDDHAPAVHFDACGYCDLLADRPPAPPPAIPQLRMAESYGIVHFSYAYVRLSRRTLGSTPRDSPHFI
ncbi:DUF2946 family protein [Burkholderia pseudomallei]|uniref:DUF2946 family protein n=1 Tax=Burkholderia pseudomallei TaxID=28450 RepID=UPI000976AEBB|nr:DUF2946 family protein [Burkholderia pseudomallei]